MTESDENLKCKRICKSKAKGTMHTCGHDLAVNPINAFVDICSGMQAIRMNHVSYIPLTYSIVKVVSGRANNVIPQT